QDRDRVDPGPHDRGELVSGQVAPAGAVGHGREQPLPGGFRQGQAGTPVLPGLDLGGGRGGDREPATQSLLLVVVVDQAVLAALDLQAFQRQGAHLAGRRPVSRKTTYTVWNMAWMSSRAQSP